MLNRLKDGARITDQDPTFKARYIGSTETFTAAGKGCTTAIVQKLWDNAAEEHLLPRVQVRITTSGIHMKSLEKKGNEQLFQIENVTFCTVDTAVNDKIFSWIYKEQEGLEYDCHAIICSSTEKAKSMSLVMSRAFQIAYKEWKASQIRSVRNDEMKQRSVSLGRLSLPTKQNRSKGQRSKSVTNQTGNEPPAISDPVVRNGPTLTFSEPNGSTKDENSNVNEIKENCDNQVSTNGSSAAHAQTANYLDARLPVQVSREVGVQADSGTLNPLANVISDPTVTTESTVF